MSRDGEPRFSEPHEAELSGRIVRGLGWKAFSQVWSQILRTVVTIALARLLGPLDFGVAAMVLVLSALIVPLSDFGLGIALVQGKTITDRDCSTVFWASSGFGALFTMAGVAAAPLVARFYGEPRVAALFAALSFDFLITGIGATQRSLLFRSMDFRSLEVRLMAGGLVGGVTAIAVAAAGGGPWALIALELVQAAVSTGLVWVFSPWRPSLEFSRDSLRRFGPYGTRFVGARVFTRSSQNADNLLIGRYLGPRPLGLYTLAYSTILGPLARIAGPIQQVFYSAFSRLQHDIPAIASTWLRATRLTAAVSIPLMAGIAVTAPDAVPAIFGERWRGAVPVIRILAPVSLVQILQGLHPAILGALDRMQLYLRFTVASFAVNLVSFVVGLQWGIVGVATCFAVASVVLAAVFTVLVAAVVEISPLRVLASLRGLWQPTLAMLAATLLCRRLALSQGVGPWGRIAIEVVVGATVYLGLVRWLAGDVVREAFALVRRGWRTRSAPASVVRTES